jgi:hypothetical protein
MADDEGAFHVNPLGPAGRYFIWTRLAGSCPPCNPLDLGRSNRLRQFVDLGQSTESLFKSKTAGGNPPAKTHRTELSAEPIWGVHSSDPGRVNERLITESGIT